MLTSCVGDAHKVIISFSSLSSSSLSGQILFSFSFTSAIFNFCNLHVLRTSTSCPPGTAIAKFLQDHEEGIEEAMTATQVSINRAIEETLPSWGAKTGWKRRRCLSQTGQCTPSMWQSLSSTCKTFWTTSWRATWSWSRQSSRSGSRSWRMAPRCPPPPWTSGRRKWRPCYPVKIQEYYGQDKSCQLGGLGERLNLCLAKLLINLGQDPNR